MLIALIVVTCLLVCAVCSLGLAAVGLAMLRVLIVRTYQLARALTVAGCWLTVAAYRWTNWFLVLAYDVVSVGVILAYRRLS